MPGVLLCAVVAAVGFVGGAVQEQSIGHAVLEPLVLSLLLGVSVRSLWLPPAGVRAGIAFVSKQVLEFAIVILGLTLNLGAIVDAGWKLLVAVLLLVSVTLIVGISLGKAMGLSTRLATLLAVGNAICGNSAIAAVAPVIRAKKEEVAVAIALTAIWGVGVVLLLPLLVPLFDLSDERYGTVAGLSVYAVPQVLAATMPVSAVAGQFGSLVKLTRVVLLGPVVALFAWRYRDTATVSNRAGLHRYLPWFVVGFFLCATLRTLNLVPTGLIAPATDLSRILTAIAMAGLGLGVDIGSVRRSGGTVLRVVSILTVLLVSSALFVTWMLGIG